MDWIDEYLDKHFGEDIIDGFRMERIDQKLIKAGISQVEKDSISNRISSMSSKEADEVERYLDENKVEENLDKQFKNKLRYDD